ncbi:hypothetical protein C8J55DRAFT_608957 [Lentinula edodes]|uniref:Mid2 domain-containing protein n=1 Tax=Lentinula lateritia TaxID=40482 RepID=A0A9W8ZV33_9AGAR|nr:hypothetical protein C8J55DRAFT_608957 [Lentinula edodes]
MDPMNIALLLLWLFLYISSSLAQIDPNSLDLSINPTITVGQSFDATWRWNGAKIPFPHPLIVRVGENDQDQPSITTLTASPGVSNGVVRLQVSETGSFRATLAMPFSGFFFIPPSTITQTAQFVVVPTTLPDTTPPPPIMPLLSPSTASGISQISTTPVFGSGTQSLSTFTPLPAASTITPTTSTDLTNSTQQSTTPSPAMQSDTSVNSLVGIILGAIFGSLSAFLLLTILVYCVWRHRRRTLPRRNTLSDLNSNGFYPNRMSANAIPSVEQALDKEEENWDAYTESSLAPSDSVSRVVWSFSQGKKKVRPLATSTTLATQSSTAANDSRESKPDATSDSGRYRSANTDLPYKIPMIIMTTATPSPPSTTVS